MRLIRLFLLPLVVLAAFAGSAFASNLDYQTKTLPNGMKLVYKVLPDSPTVTVRFVVPAGFLTEPKEQGGISHLLEHLIYRGNGKYSYKDFFHQVNEQGGWYNGGTNLSYTEFYFQVPTETYLASLEMYTDMILHPGLAEKDVTLEKKIVTVEESIRKLPGSIGWIYLSQLTDQRWDYNVKNINRDDILIYHQRFYHPNRMTVIITGSFNPEDITKSLSNFKDDTQPAPPPKSEWNSNPLPFNINVKDYLQGEKYTLLFGYDLKQISGKELVVAKVLPYLLSYESGTFDNATNRALDYEVGLWDVGDHFNLFFFYRDCQEDYTPDVSAWHQKNLERYRKFLKAKNFDRFINRFGSYLERQYQSLNVDSFDSFTLNDYYFSILFEPTAITEKDVATIKGLNSSDFKSFVQKYLDGDPTQRIVVQTIQE